MPHKRFVLRILTAPGLALVALILTMIMPAFVWADGPGITIVKEADQMVISGTNATFAITVTNSGDITLTNVAVTDAETSDCNWSPIGGILNLGEIETYTCTSYDVTESFTNTAIVSGRSMSDATIVNDNDTATVDVINPGINVEIAPPIQTVAGGSSANFTIIVTNTGDVELTLNPDDSPASPPTCTSGSYPTSDVSLPVGQVIYTCFVNPVNEGFINSLTVEGIPPVGPSVTASDAATVILSGVAAQCPADMIAYWKLDETSVTSPTTYYDDFYSGHDAESECVTDNCPISSSPTMERVNGSQIFNGTSTRVNAPVIPGDDSFNWGKDDSFSIEFWMRGVPGLTCAGSGVSNNEVIIGRDDIGLHWWLGCLNTTGYANFQLSDGGVSFVSLSSPSSVTDGAWHHLVGVRDGSSNMNRLYVDGAEVATVGYIYTADFGSASAALNIGHLGGAFHFEGDLDELAVYNKALSFPEIQAHYNNGIPGPGYCGGPFAPTIISTAPVNANVGEAYTYTVMATGDPIPTYSLSDSPPSMEITPNTGVLSWTATISWTPTTTQSETVTVEATNSEGDDTQVFTITVLPAGVAPTIPVYLPIVLK